MEISIADVVSIVNSIAIIVVGVMVYTQNRNLKFQSTLINDFKTYREAIDISKIKEASDFLIEGQLEKNKIDMIRMSEANNELLLKIVTEHSTVLCKLLAQTERTDYVKEMLPDNVELQETYLKLIKKYQAEFEADGDKSFSFGMEELLHHPLFKKIRTVNIKPI